jgi:hypothetical protein
MRQQGITAIRLPLGSGAYHHGDFLALRVRLVILAHWETFFFLSSALGRMKNTLRHLVQDQFAGM